MQSTFRSLEMFSKWRLKHFYLFGHPRANESLFSPTFKLQFKVFTKVRIFLIPFCIAFSVPKILGFRSLRKIGQSGCEIGKIKLQKIVGNLLNLLI